MAKNNANGNHDSGWKDIWPAKKENQLLTSPPSHGADRRIFQPRHLRLPSARLLTSTVLVHSMWWRNYQCLPAINTTGHAWQFLPWQDWTVGGFNKEVGTVTQQKWSFLLGTQERTPAPFAAVTRLNRTPHVNIAVAEDSDTTQEDCIA